MKIPLRRRLSKPIEKKPSIARQNEKRIQRYRTEINAIFDRHYIPFRQIRETDGSTKAYTKYRTAAEMDNARFIMREGFMGTKRKELRQEESTFIEILIGKVKEYPERNWMLPKDIKFSPKELALARRIGKEKLQNAARNIQEIDRFTQPWLEINARYENFAEHFFWHGGTQARRLLEAILGKI